VKEQLGEQGRRRVEEEFTTDVMIRQLTEIYESVLRCNSPSL